MRKNFVPYPKPGNALREYEDHLCETYGIEDSSELYSYRGRSVLSDEEYAKLMQLVRSDCYSE